MPRIAGLLALAAVLLGASACTGDMPNPFASFESRCTKLPAPRYDVAIEPLRVQEIDTAGIAELTARSGASFETDRTYGLTSVSFGHETSTELRMLEERSSGRTCAAASVEVRLSMQPAIVYVARELAGDTCRRAATRAHEQRHVEIYRAMLKEAADRLADELPRAIGAGVLQGGSGGDLRRAYDKRLGDYLSSFMRTQHQLMDARQATIDTPEEYARVAAACQS